MGREPLGMVALHNGGPSEWRAGTQTVYCLQYHAGFLFVDVISRPSCMSLTFLYLLIYHQAVLNSHQAFCVGLNIA